MPTKINQDVTVRAGETRPILITVKNESGTEISVNNDTLRYRIAKHGRMTAPYYLVDLANGSAQLTVADNGSGVFSKVTFDPGLTDLVVVGKHTHELRVEKSGGDVRVVMTGTLTILDAITHD
jgi:hypothetical protein